MRRNICILGYGRIGEVVAELLLERLSVDELAVYDTSEKRVEIAREKGLDAHLADTTSSAVAEKIARECIVAATALPSSRARAVLRALMRQRIEAIVDVSYMSNPFSLREESERYGVRLFVDAGVAPGLSNILAMRLYEKENASNIVIYVGGVSSKPREPLGLVASWNTSDLLEEYIRPARAIISGKIVEIDPLENSTTVNIPGVGLFEAIPTDGLRTLLESIRRVETLVEYTLRYPGHVEKMLFLKKLGLLDTSYKSVEGQAVKPIMLLSRLLEEKLPKTGDRIILYVIGWKRGEEEKRGYIIDCNQEKLGLKRPVLSYVTGLIHSWFALKALNGIGRTGLNKPEDIAFNAKYFRDLLSYLENHGIPVRHL